MYLKESQHKGSWRSIVNCGKNIIRKQKCNYVYKLYTDVYYQRKKSVHAARE